MKISQKQASLLAKEVQKKLKSIKVNRVSEEFKAKLREWKSKRETLKKACDDAEAALEKHDERVEQICGGVDVCGHWSITQIINKVEEREVPKLSEIEDEIILNAMFSNDEDLKTFIDKIAKKLEKKTRNKILSN